MKLKSLILLLGCLNIPNFINANEISWQHIFGDERNDIANYVIQTKDFGFVMGGWRTVNDVSKAYLRKYDYKGNIVWEKYLNGFNSYTALEDTFGNIYAATLNNFYDSKLIKLNFYGKVLWEKNYQSIRFNSLSFINNGKNFIVLGNSGLGIFHTSSLTKLDTSGNLLWTYKYYDSISVYGTFEPSYRSLIAVPSGFFFSGKLNNNNKGFIIKTDTLGNLLWKRNFTNVSYIHSIVANSYYTFIASAREFCTKFTSDGDTLWTRNYKNDTNSVWGHKIIKTPHNNFAIVGSGYYGENRLMIIDSSGNPVLRRKYFYDPANIIYSEFICNSLHDSTFTVCGSFDLSDQSYADMLIFKTDRNCNLVNINNQSIALIEDVELRIFPNPFNSSTEVEFNLLRNGRVRLEVYDILGKLVQIVLNKNFSSGIHRLKLTFPGLSSGMYFLKLSNLDLIISKRFLILK